MAYNEGATAVWHGFAESDDSKKVDSTPAPSKHGEMYERKYHEIAKRHNRLYYGEAYLLVLCCFCDGSTLERLVFSFDRVVYQPSFCYTKGVVNYVLTTTMRVAHVQ